MTTGQREHEYEIDAFFREKKSWSCVKDKIVGDYVECYLKTVHNLRRPILIVDAFAGPGRFDDGSDGSPLIICKAIARRAPDRRSMGCIFSDANPAHRAALTKNIESFIRDGVTDAPYQDCESALRRAVEVGHDSTIFYYLDPYGIKDLEFETVRQIYERTSSRSTEVLINFSYWSCPASVDSLSS